MTALIKVIQNTSRGENPSIRATSLDSDWVQAYENWIVGRNPTPSSEWKKGVFFFFEDAPVKREKTMWEADYWYEGHNVYDFFMKKYTCSKCKVERTAALCRTCINNASKKEQEAKVIDVLAPTVYDELQSKKEIVISPDLYRSLSETYSSFSTFFIQLEKFFNILREVTKSHGGDLHKSSATCPECIKEKLAWLESNHSDWRIKANEKGCCSMCINRGYDLLKNTKVKKEVKDTNAPIAMTL